MTTRTNQSQRLLIKLILLAPIWLNLCVSNAAASECSNNFVSSGNFLSGQHFKTQAEIAGKQPDDAFNAAQQYLSKEGWAIQRTDQITHTITAWPAGTRPDRPVPLNVTIEPSQRGARMTLSLSTPGVVFSKENSIRDMFCQIAGSAESTVSSEAIERTESVKSRVSTGPKVVLPTADNRVCLAHACIGMTLEDAAVLPLVPSPEGFKTGELAQCSDCPSFGLNDQGGRVWFGQPSRIDTKWIRQFSKTIKVICSMSFQLGASMKASDGGDIVLAFNPMVVDGRPQLLLTSVIRSGFPGPYSGSKWEALVQQARERYGANFYDDTPQNLAMKGEPITPHATFSGPTLRLSMKAQNPMQMTPKMMEQPGCSVRPGTLE